MTTVAVDLEDLEKLVFATAAIKAIESALSARKNDPFVKSSLEFTEAHDRLATALRNAKRGVSVEGALVGWDKPLTPMEADLLEKGIEAGSLEVGVAMKSAADQLVTKGCVRVGTLISGVQWSGSSSPDFRVEAQRYIIQPTARGVEKHNLWLKEHPKSSQQVKALSWWRRRLKGLFN